MPDRRWSLWFAWRPAKTIGGEWVWLENVARLRRPGDLYCLYDTDLKLVGKELSYTVSWGERGVFKEHSANSDKWIVADGE